MAYPATRAQMRKLRSLPATSSSEGQGVHSTESECRVDRFSSLPDGVAHHIVSFLTLRELTCFGSLSKRCTELYLSTLSSILELSEVNISTCDKLSRFLDSVDRFLNLRENKKMCHFSINWNIYHYRCEHRCICDDKQCRIIPWIKNALRCEVEELYLRILSFSYSTFKFPSCVFLCESLRTLSVELHYAAIRMPSFTCLSNLECLNLGYVYVDKGFFKWISSSCKCIKELCLEHVTGAADVTIESTSLKSLSILAFQNELFDLKISCEKLEDIHIQWCFYLYEYSRSLNIFAPNLKYLEWIGYTIDHQLGKLLHLEKANICLKPPLEGGDDNSGKVLDLLRSIHKVKVLTLQQATIMALLKNGSKSVPPLEDVSYLCIEIGSFFDDLVLALVSLLRRMPNLTSLHINSHSGFVYPGNSCSGYDKEYWRLEYLPFISQLKEVTIDLSDQSYESNQIEFSRFILECAENLKKMIIVHPPQLSLNKLKKSKKTSNAKVVFQCK